MQNNPESNKSVNKEYEPSNGWEDVVNLVKESWNKETDHATEHATDFYRAALDVSRDFDHRRQTLESENQKMSRTEFEKWEDALSDEIGYAKKELEKTDNSLETMAECAQYMILTTDEEDGMSGVNNLDFGIFSGKTLINLDTEEYGQVYVSSAGGARIFNEFNFDAEKLEDDDTVISVDVKGLLGGHSGAEIHLGLGNSNKILAEVLNHLNKKYTLSIMDIDGGEKTNAIPREAVALLAVKLEDEKVSDFEKLAKLAFENVTKDFKIIDKHPVIEVKEIKKEELKNQGKMSISNTNAVISFFHEFPNGVIAMSKDIEGLVETSINLGVIKTENKDGKINIKVQSLPRSSVNKSLEKLLNDVKELSEKYEVAVKINSPYPSWEYRKDSKIRDIVVNSFKKITEKEPEIKAIHAGLECGVFDNNMENVDIVSIGPNIYGAHTPEERMEIDSVGKTWELLLKAMEDYNIKK